MADSGNNILKHLQDFEINAPAGACKKAWEGILLQNDEAANGDKKDAFEKLQEYSLEAPLLDFKSLINGKKPAAKKIPLFSKGIARAAAAIFLVLACSVAYFALFKKQKPSPSEYASTSTLDTNNAAAVPDSHLAAAQIKANEEAEINALIKQNEEKAAVAKNNAENIKAGKFKSNSIKYNRGNSSQLYDNDIFFTLVNYKEFGRDKLFLKALADKTITLNKYSYINISDKMAAMLQEVYITKKNGKPARKAKKAKKKFDKWRKKDEKYFDKRLEKNPADILDLSDFLMNN
jgi:hypothetical protein